MNQTLTSPLSGLLWSGLTSVLTSAGSSIPANAYTTSTGTVYTTSTGEYYVTRDTGLPNYGLTIDNGDGITLDDDSYVVLH